jgi:hypothetical protein
LVATVLLVAGCGDLPQPFRGNPGAEGQLLSAPPPSRLAVATPTDALLSDAAASDFASDLAADLQENEVPAVAKRKPDKGDWRLLTRAEDRGGHIVLTYAIIDPKGKDVGHAEGAPVPLADWAAGSAPALKAAAVDATPRITDLLRGVEATNLRSDPNSLYNRPPKVFIPTVTGAPGDGNTSLTLQMRRQLATHGEVVQDTGNGADFIVAGHVNAVPIAGGMLRVEIMWRMHDSKNRDLGMVLQLNEVPPDTVQGFWGEVALAVAKEAAGGVHETVLKNSGHNPPQASAPPDAASGSTVSATAPAAAAPPAHAAASGAAAVPIPRTARIPGAPPGNAAAAAPQAPAATSQ